MALQKGIAKCLLRDRMAFHQFMFVYFSGGWKGSTLLVEGVQWMRVRLQIM